MGYKQEKCVMEHKPTLDLSLQFSPGKCESPGGSGRGGPGKDSLEGDKLWNGSGQRRLGR